MHKPSTDLLLARLLALHPKLIDLSLDRMHRILATLGAPEKNLPPIIHIAGTNGKGSTLAMIRAGLESMGKTVHTYTSPHLVRFHERICLGGMPIPEEALADLLEEIEKKNAQNPITFFEVTTAAAFLAFSRVKADYLLLEVGLGGRLDATNVIVPKLSVITPLGMDHEAYLGDTLEKIAFEKSGIIKPKIPVHIGAQNEEALRVLVNVAQQNSAPCFIQGQDFDAHRTPTHLTYQDATHDLILPPPALIGAHQTDNAALAISVLLALGADANTLSQALLNVQWPARMQRLETGPLVTLGQGAEIWLDGGHNPHAAAALAATLETLPDKETIACVGMLNTKNVGAYFQNLAPMVQHVYAVPIEGEPNSLDPQTIQKAAQAANIQAHVAPNLEAALTKISNIASKRILICGSLHLAGVVLRDHT